MLLSFVGFRDQLVPAGSPQPLIVLGYSQRIAVETLFRYCAMEKNPFYLEREKKRSEQEVRLRKLLEKRSEDLTPLQQIELFKHTIDPGFADPIAAKTLKAFIFAWGLFEFVEFAWRVHCREQNYLHPNDDWFEKKTSFGIQMDPSSRESKGYLYSDSTADCNKLDEHDNKKTFPSADVIINELVDSVSPLRKRMVDIYSSLKSKRNPASAGKQKTDHAYDFDVIGEPIESNQLPIEIETEQRRVLTEGFFGRTKKYPYIITTHHKYKNKPERLEFALWLLNYGIKLAPAIMMMGRLFWRHVLGNYQTPQDFLDRLFKNFSSEYIAGFGGEDHKKYLLDVLITPLWKKHRGNEQKICEELALMGAKLRKLEGVLAAGSRNQKTLNSLVMGVHGGVLPFEQAKLFGRINRAFEQGIVSRAFKAGFTTFAIGCAQLVFLALTKRRIGEIFKGLSHSLNNYGLSVSCVLFSYWTFKECMVKAWNYDNSQARKDYDIFLKRLELQKQVQYIESFYWAWFYPMWRAQKRNVLEVETCFFKRVDEVRKLFDTPVAV